MKNKNFFEVLCFETPWYISLLLGVIVYFLSLFIKQVNPSLMLLGFPIQPILKVFAILFIIAAFCGGVKYLANNFLFRRTNSLEDIKKLSWWEFENLIETYYSKKGYHVIRTTYRGSDGGIDLIAKKDGEKVIIQCKHWKAYKVDVKVIREMYGIMVDEKASRCVVITSGDFTEAAKDFASDKPIELINGKKLVELIGEIKKDELAEEKSNETVILCPKCNGRMVLRVAKHGEHAGKKFWGCSNYPQCRYIIDIKE